VSNQDQYTTFENHQYAGFLVIPCPDRNAGFSVMMTYALNGVRLAIQKNLLPVINFDHSDRKYFYDKLLGPNIWDYYWEPVMGMTFERLTNLIQSSRVDPFLVTTLSGQEICNAHLIDSQRIATYPVGYEIVTDRTKWMSEKRDLGRKFVAKYIKIKPRILEKVDLLGLQYFDGCFVFGVHIRGTDLFYAEATKPDDYFIEIEKLASVHNLDYYKVFIATDQVQFVELFRKRFGDRLVCYDSIRSSNQIAPFKHTGVSQYRKGEDVLIDILLLSKCNHVLKCAASVGEYALWFNPEVPYTDFSLNSKPLHPKSYEKAKGAFLQMNLGNEGSFFRVLRTTHSFLTNFLEKRILRFDPHAWRRPDILVKKFCRSLSRRFFSSRN
jgi:hypothetical protein